MIDQAARRARWIPWALALPFVAMLPAQAWFVYLAVSTDPGQQVQNAYERGLAHNAVLRRAAEQSALGWSMSSRVVNGELEIVVLNRRQEPIGDLQVAVEAARPVGDRGSRVLPVSSAAGGIYRVILPEGAGQWQVAISAQGRSGSASWNERIYVK